MGSQLCNNRFDIEACCVTMLPSRKKGESLVLPYLKLKDLIEAIRLVLEIVYDERFVTFSYGGRVSMGRHTAIRYLKNSVENPSWWFSVTVDRESLMLCLFIGEKIKDGSLIGLIKRLFECEVMGIELGGCYLGRGFPQESGLCSILINIYFNGFDKEIQDMRLQKNQENLKFKLEQLMYVMLTMDFVIWVLKYLEGRLVLRVDKMKMAIHSVVSENISFLGMELQAVPPSVLHPPMTKKAIRTRKKYLRLKEVRALEFKNARERNRKILGMKILQHVFKKLKQSNGFKFDFQIENEIGEIFRNWTDEVVQDFLGSLEERQLPQKLVDAYDKFQEKVDKYLSPVQARKALEKEERRVKEEEKWKYAKSTIKDLMSLYMKVDAPIELVRKAVKMAGFTNNMGCPRPIKLLIALEDVDIIKWYAGVGRRWLDFFCCCHNLKMVKTVLTYHLRFSCILTLVEKHESTKRETIKHYTKDLKVSDFNGNEKVYIPTEREVKLMGDQNLSDPRLVDGAVSLALIRLASDEPSCSCIGHFCDRMDTVYYQDKWVPGMGAIHESLNQKCLPLYSHHINDLYMGNITLQDIDYTEFVDVD
ncbi:hypothetical protein RGQ29_024496 [Quercus rubra]|uniref:Domain X domain-containing protein n=1 Tax=Quercus rubra TaxID=3512 RepID=A0AAN7IGN4_QUERU|nr:hypothetical protein RGQ29_024496 [Quercus rubra]